MAASAIPIYQPLNGELQCIAAFPGLRVLTWDGNVLYASRAYQLLRADLSRPAIHWQEVTHFRPSLWRNVSSRFPLSCRLLRDGFHALAVLPSGHRSAALPGVIATLAPGETEFRVSHRITRGTRPLHITATPDGKVFWGEYFDNRHRDEVHIYVSEDQGTTWDVAYSFHRHSIRHIHNIVYDEWQNCLWVLTGDEGPECRILRASLDFTDVEAVLHGNQQARAVALLPAADGLYFSSDTPLEHNYIYRLDRRGNLYTLASLTSSSIYGCRVSDAMYFSTMVEPSAANPDRHVRIYGSLDGVHWRTVVQWKKDRWSMKLFQYGNAILPAGKNNSGLLAMTSVAVTKGDLETTLWRVTPKVSAPEPS